MHIILYYPKTKNKKNTHLNNPSNIFFNINCNFIVKKSKIKQIAFFVFIFLYLFKQLKINHLHRKDQELQVF